MACAVSARPLSACPLSACPLSRSGQRGACGRDHTYRVAQDRSTGFLPSANGFAFANSWPSVPAVSVPLIIGSVGIGNAARGLCGGMVYGALDYWYTGVVPPAAQPAAGTPLFRFIVRRLVDSWQIPIGVARYYRWMQFPDLVARHETISEHWPAVKAKLDAGVPATIGVVTVASANPLQLGANHQVIAYAYSVAGSEVTLRVYDPNSGPADDIWIRFVAAGGTAASAGFAHNLGLNRPVRGFFLTSYSAAAPFSG